MSITSSGAFCDVCNNYILPIADEMVNSFTVKGIGGTLHCHNKCKDIVQTCFKNKDWKSLPNGRLRECFEKYYKEEK
jgi:hypothetical protein